MLVSALLIPALLSPPEPIRVAVTVKDRFDRPVTGARACVVDGERCVPQALEGLAAPPEARLRVEAPGFKPAEVSAQPRVDVRLEARGGVSLRLRLPAGGAPATVNVGLAAIEGRRTFSERTLLEERVEIPEPPADGAVRFAKVPPGTYALSWSGPSLATGKRLVTVKEDENADGGSLLLETGVTLAGDVRDEAGAVVDGASVSLSPVPGGDASGQALLLATSAPDGTYSLRGVPVGKKAGWVARREGYETARGIWGGETRLPVVLRRAQVVTGVVKGADGVAVPEARVGVVYRSSSGANLPGTSVKADGEGRFTVSRAETHPMTLTVRAPGFQNVYRDLPTPGGQDPRSVNLGEIRLTRGRSISGVVTSRASGEPVAGVRVEAGRQKIVTLAGVNTDEAASTETDGSGRYELGGLPSDVPLAIRASVEGFAPQTATSEPEKERYDFTLGSGGRVEGLVCGPAHELASAEIWVGGSSRYTITVDPQGRFTADRLEPGPLPLHRAWKVRSPAGIHEVMSTGGGTRVVVEEGKTVQARVGCDGHPVSGSVTLDGRPLALYVGVAINDVNGHDVLDFLVDEGGRFSLRLAEGRYSFRFVSSSSRDWRTTPAGVTCQVPPGGTDSCTFAIASGK